MLSYIPSSDYIPFDLSVVIISLTYTIFNILCFTNSSAVLDYQFTCYIITV